MLKSLLVVAGVLVAAAVAQVPTGIPVTINFNPGPSALNLQVVTQGSNRAPVQASSGTVGQRQFNEFVFTLVGGVDEYTIQNLLTHLYVTPNGNPEVAGTSLILTPNPFTWHVTLENEQDNTYTIGESHGGNTWTYTSPTSTPSTFQIQLEPFAFLPGPGASPTQLLSIQDATSDEALRT